MILIKNLSLEFKDKVLFDDISFSLDPEQRYALVGRNGTGKSTLLKIIAQQGIADSGTVEYGNTTIAYLSQDITLTSQESIIEETVRILGEIEPEDLARTEAEAGRILCGLGFKKERLNDSVATLSGGFKMRVVLAQLLLKRADFYLFDEPTNHLDIVAKDWFLSYLEDAQCGFVLVCHERYFLDKLCNKTIALEHQKATFYDGNYSTYKEKAAHARALREQAALQQQKFIAQRKEVIARFGASAARAKQAQAMKKELERLEIITIDGHEKVLSIPLPAITPSGRTVLTATKLRHTYSTKELFKDVSFVIERGDKVALIGANGLGKTTILHALAGLHKLLENNFQLGYNVTMALFHQDQLHVLDGSKTIYEEVSDSAPTATTQQLRAMLGAFLFSHDAIHKKIGVLSGGERSRVGMMKVLLQNANFLVLDEPTNHLDMESKEVLLEALKKFQGTILFVSHDHDFINQLATKIFELTPTGIEHYSGNYDDYLYQKAARFSSHETVSITKDSADKKSTQSHTEHPVNTKNLERKIKQLEEQQAQLGLELAEYDYGTPEFSSRYEKLQKIEKELKVKMDEWAKLNTL